MHEMYFSIKWIHILGACIGLGSNITHLFWLMAANGDSEHRANILRLVKKIDDYMAVPAWAITVMAGMTMWLWKWPTNTSWIIMSLILTTILTVMGIAFGPLMKRWIRMAKDEPDSTALPRWNRRLTIWWALIALSALIVLFMMVRKPMLW